MKILIPVQDRHVEKEMLSFIQRLASRDGTDEITVLHVIGLPTYGFHSDLDFYERHIQQNQKFVDSIAESVRKVAPTNRVKGMLIEGDAANVILRVATELPADVILIGSHGRGPIGKFFMGSVSQEVLSHAPCAVMLVRESQPSTKNAVEQTAVTQERK
jgi:nucleotide-binding universal stress UspA family protein